MVPAFLADLDVHQPKNHALAAADGSARSRKWAVVLKDTFQRDAIQPRAVQPPADEFDEGRALPDQRHRIPTSVADIETCVAHAFNPELVQGLVQTQRRSHHVPQSNVSHQDAGCALAGEG